MLHRFSLLVSCIIYCCSCFPSPKVTSLSPSTEQQRYLRQMIISSSRKVSDWYQLPSYTATSLKWANVMTAYTATSLKWANAMTSSTATSLKWANAMTSYTATSLKWANAMTSYTATSLKCASALTFLHCYIIKVG